MHPSVIVETIRACDCGCGRKFRVPPTALHKRFFNTACRNKWHSQHRIGSAIAEAHPELRHPPVEGESK